MWKVPKFVRRGEAKDVAEHVDKVALQKSPCPQERGSALLATLDTLLEEANKVCEAQNSKKLGEAPKSPGEKKARLSLRKSKPEMEMAAELSQDETLCGCLFCEGCDVKTGPKTVLGKSDLTGRENQLENSAEHV